MPVAAPCDQQTEVVENPTIAGDVSSQLDEPWVTIVWNDPVNLMSYVSWVFQSYFGYAEHEAEKLMMQVHTDGRAVVSRGTREKMETDTEAMHSYSLWATFRKDD